MRKLRSSILAVGVMALCLAQGTPGLLTPDVRRVANQLACLCGCKQTVADCTMLECHYSKPAREKIAKMQAVGISDEDILKSFVQDSGLQALAAPPNEGFNRLAWLMPWVAIAVGLAAIYLFIRKFHPRRAPASMPELDPETLARYRAHIDQDLEKLD